MRVTGDSPLVSLELGEYIIKEHLSSNKDVTYTTSQVAYGIACEIYKTSAILKLKKILPDTTHSEYLIYYFMNNPRYFELNPIEAPAEFIRPWRLTLDEENDLKLLNMIYHSLKRKYAPVLFKELVSFFHDSPEMALVNINNAVKYKEDKALAIFLKEQTTIKK